MAASVTLSSIHDLHGNNYGRQPPPLSRGCPRDPLYAWPTSRNGYLPLGHPLVSPQPLQPGSDHHPLIDEKPRQCVSIACAYCKQHKTRCSGFPSAPGGKCQNCTKMSQACVFRFISCSSSEGFVPVLAVQGSVPPEKQLSGAYGQPLAPNLLPGEHFYSYYGKRLPNDTHYGQLSQSPTKFDTSHSTDTRDDTTMTGKRSRQGIDQEEKWRRKAPRITHADHPRRRSPAEISSKTNPGGGSYPSPSGQQSMYAPGSSTTVPQSRSFGEQNGYAPTPASQPGVPATHDHQGPMPKMELRDLMNREKPDGPMPKMELRYLMS
ncbi:hypothetical protein PWT90_10921 [Aphanocladium album]|nr:hypothetical protein PWT90_10921 [Aphanocladium album]